MIHLRLFESIETLDRTIKDKSRDRSIPLKFYFPVGKTNSPVILFSHGLGGSRNGCSLFGKTLGRSWICRCIYAACWGVMNRFGKMWVPFAECLLLRKPPPPRILCLGCRMFPPFWINLKLESKIGFAFIRQDGSFRVGMSGHSFGALTTQAVSGEKIPLSKSLTEPRIRGRDAIESG